MRRALPNDQGSLTRPRRLPYFCGYRAPVDLSTQAQLRPFIVHERFTELGGSELVVEQLHAMWPEATIGTTVLDRSALPLGLRDAHIETSPLQRIYRGGSRYAQLLPLLPLAMRFMHIPECDVIITSHHAFANRIRGRRDAPIVSYTHTPPRWLWDSEKLRAESGGVIGGALLRAFAATQRHADRAAAQRVDRIVANSQHVAGRIRNWWNRDADVVYPPVDTERLTCADVAREEFFLLAGRLIPYKRPDVAIAAARQAGVRLVVAGDGRMRKTLESESGSGIEFLGRVTDDELRDLYRRCRCARFPRGRGLWDRPRRSAGVRGTGDRSRNWWSERDRRARTHGRAVRGDP